MSDPTPVLSAPEPLNQNVNVLSNAVDLIVGVIQKLDRNYIQDEAQENIVDETLRLAILERLQKALNTKE